MPKQIKNINWTVIRCLTISKQHQSVSDWMKHSPACYKAAKCHGWLDACCAQMPKIKGKVKTMLTKKLK